MAPVVRTTCKIHRCNAGEDGNPNSTLEGLSTQDSVLKDLELYKKNGPSSIFTQYK